MRRLWLLVAAAALVAAVALGVGDGVRTSLAGIRVSARSPWPLVGTALAATAVWMWRAARAHAIGTDLTELWAGLVDRATLIVWIVALAGAGAAIGRGTYSAAGADASGYLSQAEMWSTGRSRLPDVLSSIPAWRPADPGVTAPLGWRASEEPGWQVPTYAPGLPLLMALPHRWGGQIGAALIVPLSAMLAILATASVAYRLGGGGAAVLSALLLATTPVFLYQAQQPMSDVPVTAAWMTCWAVLLVHSPRSTVRSPNDADRALTPEHRGPSTAPCLAAGVLCALALLIRPNLAPVAIVPAVYVAIMAPRGDRLRQTFSFAVPIALAGLALAWLQWQWYGSPFRSGYGTADQLFSPANIAPNAKRYLIWTLGTSPVLLLAPLGVVRRPSVATWTLVVFAVAIVAAYLVYFEFNEWMYLRFLLPALAVAAGLVGVAMAGALDLLPVASRLPVISVLALSLVGSGLTIAVNLDVFRLADSQRRVNQIDRYLDAVLPANAVVISGEQSGAVRADTARPILRWEAATPEELQAALAALGRAGRPAWWLLDAWEEALVRAKFHDVSAAHLDWPPAVDAGDGNRTRAWNLADRERYLQGERVITDRLR